VRNSSGDAAPSDPGQRIASGGEKPCEIVPANSADRTRPKSESTFRQRENQGLRKTFAKITTRRKSSEWSASGKTGCANSSPPPAGRFLCLSSLANCARDFRPRARPPTASLRILRPKTLRISARGADAAKPPQLFWSWRRDSNPRPSDYKSDALPTELRQQHWGKRAPPRKLIPRIPSRCPGQLYKVAQRKERAQGIVDPAGLGATTIAIPLSETKSFETPYP
jgi:hypothetical protein